MSAQPPNADKPLPPVSPNQAAALFRAGMGVCSDVMSGAFAGLCKAALTSSHPRYTIDATAPYVQRIFSSSAESMRTAFINKLAERQEKAIDALLPGRSIGSTLRLDASALSLVDVDSAQGAMLVERSGKRVTGIVDENLRLVDLVVSFLSGRQKLRSSDSPFAPEVFVGAMLDAAEHVDLSSDCHDLFLAVIEKPLGDELNKVYTALLDAYRGQNVDATVLRRQYAAKGGSGVPGSAGGLDARGAATAGGPGTSGAAGGGAAGAAGAGGQGGAGSGSAAGGLQIDAGKVLGDLWSRLQAGSRGVAMPALPNLGPATPGLLNAVSELQHLGLQGGGPGGGADTTGTISSWREHLVEKSSRTVDKLTIEIVGMLFDQVMRDKQVPAEIKALLSRLQFPVLKAALLDADIFTANTHPARRLIDRIASTAVGWEPYGDENEKYLAEVNRVVREVLGKFDKDVSVFEKLLGEFETFVGDIPHVDADPVSRAKRALEDAEKREILVINTTIQVRRAFEKVELEPYLRDFLVGPWVQVLVTASMRENEQQGFSKRFRQAIHDIVWSVQPKASVDDRKRLVELIPIMSRIVRDGLALIRMPERDQQEFFQQIMASHAMAVKPVDQARYIKSSLMTSELRAQIDGMQLTGTFPITTVTGGIRVPTGALMRMAEQHDASLQMPDPVTDIANLDRVEVAELDEEIGSWQRGTWFNFWDGKEFVKAKLRWVSPLRTLFLFTTEPDRKTHVMAPDVIKSYLKRNYLKPLESVQLTKRAVDGVVGEFEKMPTRAQEMASRYTISQDSR